MAAAAIKLSAKVQKSLASEDAELLVNFLTALRDGKYGDDALLTIGDAVATHVEKVEEAAAAKEAEAKKAEAAKRKAEGTSRLPAAPKKKSADEEDAGDDTVKLVEGRFYTAPDHHSKLDGVVLEFTGKYVAKDAAKNAGLPKLRALSGELVGKLVPVPVEKLKVARKPRAKKNELVNKVPASAVALVLPPFARSTTVIR